MRRNTRNRRPNRSGMTLLEIMVVLIILVTIAGLAVTAYFGQQERANRMIAYNYVTLLANQIKLYEVNNSGQTPPNLDALVVCPPGVSEASWGGPYLEISATSLDPWGFEYQYDPQPKDGRRFSIWSVGKDGISGTDDDIKHWEKP